jgi:hypothetical protein
MFFSTGQLASPWPVDGQSHVIAKYSFTEFLEGLANWPMFALAAASGRLE